MSQISWEEYFKSQIIQFRDVYEKQIREKYEKLLQKTKKLSKIDSGILNYSLASPCQIVVVDFNEPYLKCFIVLHDEKFPDLHTSVLNQINTSDLSTKLLGQVELLQRLHDSDLLQLISFIGNNKEELMHGDIGATSKNLGGGFVALLRTDPRFSNATFGFARVAGTVVLSSIDEALRRKDISNIRETVGDLKKDAQTIQVKELRTKIVEKTERLENKIENLEGKLESEVSGVRKIIGNAREFQDFRVFATDVTDLKKSHVPREAFITEMKRLDDRIDRGLEALNSRVSSLADVKVAYDTLLAQQNEFMKQQADVMKQQASFVTWIKYATILLPIAVISVPIIEIIRYLLGMH